MMVQYQTIAWKLIKYIILILICFRQGIGLAIDLRYRHSIWPNLEMWLVCHYFRDITVFGTKEEHYYFQQLLPKMVDIIPRSAAWIFRFHIKNMKLSASLPS